MDNKEKNLIFLKRSLNLQVFLCIHTEKENAYFFISMHMRAHMITRVCMYCVCVCVCVYVQVSMHLCLHTCFCGYRLYRHMRLHERVCVFLGLPSCSCMLRGCLHVRISACAHTHTLPAIVCMVCVRTHVYMWLSVCARIGVCTRVCA